MARRVRRRSAPSIPVDVLAITVNRVPVLAIGGPEVMLGQVDYAIASRVKNMDKRLDRCKRLLRLPHRQCSNIRVVCSMMV